MSVPFFRFRRFKNKLTKVYCKTYRTRARAPFHDQEKHPVFCLRKLISDASARMCWKHNSTNLYGDAVKPVAVHAQIKRVDANKPIRRRDHSWHQRNLNKQTKHVFSVVCTAAERDVRSRRRFSLYLSMFRIVANTVNTSIYTRICAFITRAL